MTTCTTLQQLPWKSIHSGGGLERIAILRRKTHLGLHITSTGTSPLHLQNINTPSQRYHNTPHKATTIQYGAKVQRVEEDKSPPLTPDQIKCVQKIIVGTLLYYGRTVDSTLLTALSAIAARQSNGTQVVTEACHQLLDYVAMHPDAGIRYHVCDMILAVHTDASYLSEPGGKSRAAGISISPIETMKISTMAPF